MFYGQGFSAMLCRAASVEKKGAAFSVIARERPRAYGVVEFDETGQSRFPEKPEVPKSNDAVPGSAFL